MYLLRVNMISKIPYEAYKAYKERNYDKAVEFYQKTLEFNPVIDDIYVHLRYYLSLYHNDQSKKAKEYINEYSNTIKDNQWIAQIVHFYTGKIAEDELIKSSDNLDSQKDKEQKCEAFYYVGMAHLLKMEHARLSTPPSLEKAREYFEKCLATDVKNFREYELAKIELDRMGQ